MANPQRQKESGLSGTWRGVTVSASHDEKVLEVDRNDGYTTLRKSSLPLNRIL